MKYIYNIMNNDETLQTFVSITGKDYGKALTVLESVDWDLQKALNIENESNKIENEIRPADNTTNMRLVDEIENVNIFEQHIENISFGNESDYINNNESFEKIKNIAKNEEKHILISVLSDNLESIQINSRLWNKENVQDVISNQFICYQCQSTNQDGQRLVNVYNIIQFPYVFLIDYRTYENIYTFQKLSDDNDFICEVFNYLEPEEDPVIKIEEPDVNSINAYFIKFSFVQTNTTKTRTFLKTEYIQTLYNYISQEFEIVNFKLSMRYPIANLEPLKHKTLEDIKLNNCIIIVDTNI